MSKITYDFIVEYAKSNRSTCHTSKEKIEKGEIRIGKMIQSTKFDGKIPVWHHWKYFFSKGNQGLTKWEMLHDRDKLRGADQEKIKKLIQKHAGGEGEGEGEAKSKKRKASADNESEKKKKKKKDDSDSDSDSDESDDEEPEKKEKKEETEEQKAVRLENELLWEFKDQLKSYKPKDLKRILEYNKQSSSGGADALIERIANGMAFGALPEGCGQDGCSGGHVYFARTEGKYKCSGKSEWSRCSWEADTVTVKAWKFPEWLKEDSSYFDKWKWKKRERAQKKTEVIRAEGRTDEGFQTEEAKKAERAKRKFFQIGTASEKPFTGYLVAFSGKFKKKIADLEGIVKELGGKTSSSVSTKVTHLVATQDAVDDESSKVEDAIKYDIPILSVDWVNDTYEKKVIVDQKLYLIGGSDHARNLLTREFTNPEEDEKREKEEQEKEVKVQLVMKGRSAVDPAAGQNAVDNYHVLDLGDTEIYNVVLNLADVTTNSNSYYCLQLLEHDKHEDDYIVFRKWGRVGTKIGDKKIENFNAQEEAIAKFEEVYLDKTGNEWEDRDVFEKKPNKFFPVEIDYTENKDDPLKKAKQVDDKDSKLDGRLKSLISLIFNIDLMENSLLQMEIDLKKMPLGKLSKQHIKKGYDVLTEIDQTLKAGGPKMQDTLVRLTNQFYTLIPHDFGLNQIPLIDSMEQLQKKMQLMEALIDIEIATSLLKEGDNKVDENYKKLNTNLVPLNRDDPEFSMVETYMLNQRGGFKLKLLDAFKVARNGENDRYMESAPLGNRQLLWHGSRVTNYVGILSQGLRIAPPEAPKSGYRFGKGIYFADICEKSAHYCRGGGAKDVILMMLVEVALGKMAELLHDQYMEQPLPGYNSTKALGAVAPATVLQTVDGLIVPSGPIGNTRIKSSCTHNEYIVYSVKQACIRYLLKIELEG